MPQQKTLPSKEKELNKLIDHLLLWIKRDWVVIIILLIALGICAAVLVSVDVYQDQINEHWINQWDSICRDDQTGYVPILFNTTYDFWGDYNG